ncbi:MAG TPA: NADH-quinone oxidoreductase subunit L [Myxococcota bacterium]|nr:NADH-quinone oxidoreductase subunit L [Myxococcota bacterium]
MNENTDAVLRWIPLLPLLAAAVHGVMIGLVRRSAPRWFVNTLSCGSVGLSFLLSCYAFFRLVYLKDDYRWLTDSLYTWFGAGVGDTRFSAEMGLRLDPLSSIMTLVVTGVGFLIHLYSIGYMADDHREDRGYQRFFCYLNLFTFSMLVLVMADNLVLLFLGWEGVGLCSYLLIGFWYSDRWNAFCGSKAFIVNRIGDFGFLVGIFLIFSALAQVGSPSVAFADIRGSFDLIKNLTIPAPFWGESWRIVEVAGICFFIGAVGKSAQIPLYVWLPDAMAGPTPVSALIHAATMVTAGDYMVARLAFLYSDAPIASSVMAWTGGLTAFFAASIAVCQTDIKKVLAYSTVSQLGYMFLAAGSGGYTASIFHLVTHAFFKALLFLGAGSVILAMHHEQDIEKMGGLARRIRQTHFVFLIGVIAIAGFPPFSGFFSKDEILLATYASHVPGHFWLYGIGLVTAGITSFYMFRLYYKVFHGECRAPADVREHIHEQPGIIVNPLWVLAFLSMIGGLAGFPLVYGAWFGVKDSHSLDNWLNKVVGYARYHVPHSTEYTMALTAIGMAAAGLLLARFLYVSRPDLPPRIAASFAGLQRLLANKYWVDEIYDALIVRPLVLLSERVFYRGVDAGLIDGVAVNGLGRSVRGIAAGGLKYLQSGLTQSYVFSMLVGAAAILWYLAR